MMKKWKFFQKNFYPKCSYVHAEYSFYSPVDNVFQKAKSFSFNLQK